jgi:alpha-ketoglutarate-dependent taurine dioxygenase
VIATRPAGPVGAVVEGVDPERLLRDDGFPAWFLDTLSVHGVLVLPRIDIDDATLVGFTRRLGTPMHFGIHPEHPELWPVTLDRSQNPSTAYLRASVAWHIDGTMTGTPARATLLTARILSEGGDGTEFASTYAAYEALTAAERERLAGLRVVHTRSSTQRAIHPDLSDEESEAMDVGMRQEHPLVWQHEDGRRSLVVGASAASVVGMAPDEGRRLLDELIERTTAPDRVYRHEWQLGDLVVWDNTGTVHRAVPYELTSPRTMHRTTIEGVEPIR